MHPGADARAARTSPRPYAARRATGVLEHSAPAFRAAAERADPRPGASKRTGRIGGHGGPCQ